MEESLFIDAMSYFDMIYRYNIDYDYNEFYDEDGRVKYELLLKKLQVINLPDVDSFDYSSLSLKEIIEMLNSVLNKIFGSEFHREFKSFSKKIVPSEKENMTGSKVLLKRSFNRVVAHKIIINADLVSIDVVLLAHEYMHALLAKYIVNFSDVVSNIHYDELISIFIEYIVANEINKMFKKDKLIRKTNIIRLESLKKGSIDCDRVGNNVPYISDYVRHKLFSYVISDIYATRLLEIYKEDKGIMKKIISILKGKDDVDNLREFYNLSLANNQVVDGFVKKIDFYDKISMNR